MEILLPAQTKTDWQQLLSNLASTKPLKPFEALSREFIQELWRTIMKDKDLRSYPELIAMAHWMRLGHLKEIWQTYEAKRQNRIWLPRGVVLHFAPANVDTMFIYSWFLSLLIGNINIIRLSQNRTIQIQLLLNMLNAILDKERFKAIRDRSLILSYGHEESITKKLSQFCQVRVIWGGDETARQIRSIALPANANELVFADKFSMAALKAEAILETSEGQLNSLVRNFYNDAFWFNQMACSSPRLVFWIGEEEYISKAKKRFWPALERLIQKKRIDWPAEIGITRMVTGHSYAAQGVADKLLTVGTELPYRVHVGEFKRGLREQHCGAGLFLEAEKANLMDVIGLISYKDQTLAVYGFSRDELEKFSWQLAGWGIDRIVPIGQALNFQIVWDGYDLLTYLTREVTIT